MQYKNQEQGAGAGKRAERSDGKEIMNKIINRLVKTMNIVKDSSTALGFSRTVVS